MVKLDIPQLPVDALELLDDPQLAGLRSRGPGIPNAGKTLRPSQPPHEGESPFVIFRTDFEYMRASTVEWVNEPIPSGASGDGKGFPTLRNGRPHFTEDQSKPAQLQGAWEYSSWLIASAKFAATLRAFDPTVIETVEIDWSYADGQKLDGYVFLDVTRLLYAYDYRRSVVHVQIKESGKFISGLGAPRTLKRDLPSDVHVFRESYWRFEIFFSREIARALLAAEPCGFYFEEPATGGRAMV
jgi:hypothetical protein